MKNKWELKLHDDVEDPYYELTNGQTTLCANCGFVGETDEGEDAIFKKVADSLNESGIDWHSENALELKQHIEIQALQSKYDELKAENERLKYGHELIGDALRNEQAKSKTLLAENAAIKAKAQRLVDALEQLLSRFKPEPHNTWDKKALLVANKALLEWGKEPKEGGIKHEY